MALDRLLTKESTMKPGESAQGGEVRFGERWGSRLAAGVILLAGIAVYWNSFSGVFVYDDLPAIVDNPTIRQLGAMEQVLSPPNHGETVSGRPVLNLSLALNYALGRTDPWGYHLANLAIHIVNGLLLLGILRRTFCLPLISRHLGDAALGVALAISLLWTVHPLQTESVTYIVQRAESLGALFYLLVLYTVIRGSQSPQAFLWYVPAVVASLLGVATKEVVATAPVMVLLYDRTFLSGSFRQAFRRRWGLYVGLFASWGLLAGLLSWTRFVGGNKEVDVVDLWPYARSQPGVILHYLRLSVWPHPLCFNYEWPVAAPLNAILPAILVGLMIGATARGLRAGRTWGFLGAWFFLILAPTSSIMPLRQLAFEHRMYLPLAAVLTLMIVGGHVAVRRWASRGCVKGRWCVAGEIGVIVLAAGTLSGLTLHRNHVYHSHMSLWEDTIAVAPGNPHAHYNRGVLLSDARRFPEAIQEYEQALRIKPDYAVVHNNLAGDLASVGRQTESIEHYLEAIRLSPHDARAQNNLGLTLAAAGRLPEAIEHYQEAVRLKPGNAETRNNLGAALAKAGQLSEAVEQYQEAIRLRPEYAPSYNNLGSAMLALGRPAETIKHCEEALRIDPSLAGAQNNLGSAMLALGRPTEAIEHFQRTLKIQPDLATASYNLAYALSQVGRLAEASERYQETVRIEPHDAQACNNWGTVLLHLDRVPQAVAQFEQAVRLKPDYANAHYNLALVLARTGKMAESLDHVRQAVRLQPEAMQPNRLLAWMIATQESLPGGTTKEAVEAAQRACRLTGQRDASCLDTLAAVYAQAGRFDEAVTTAKEAWQLARAAGQNSLAEEIHVRLQLYRDRKPYHEPTPSSGRR
jgi:tetratricopeptide (TPR) repeat protein